jgi:hypothetical protein
MKRFVETFDRRTVIVAKVGQGIGDAREVWEEGEVGRIV